MLGKDPNFDGSKWDVSLFNWSFYDILCSEMQIHPYVLYSTIEMG